MTAIITLPALTQQMAAPCPPAISTWHCLALHGGPRLPRQIHCLKHPSTHGDDKYMDRCVSRQGRLMNFVATASCCLCSMLNRSVQSSMRYGRCRRRARLERLPCPPLAQADMQHLTLVMHSR